ncbi:MAG: hypothetical protein HY704_07415 [Gemmatimonadetes bacterium]|nr:hypothetical protein [Gemmatimonadota bacterium]
MRDEIVILGIHDGHNASACVLRDGEIVAAACEERLSRHKNEPGYPRRAVEEVLRIAGCTPDEITIVALGTRFMHHREFFLSWDWYRKGYSDQTKDAGSESQRRRYFLEERLRERRNAIVQHLGVGEEQIEVVEHHEAHAASAYYGSPWIADGRVLVLTLDGSGDGVCATVNIGEGGELRRIAETKSAASLGKVYSRVTFLLGMKPWEHEYKIMGLAPYADADGVERSYEVLRPLVQLDEGALAFQAGTHLSTNYCYPYLRTELENHRFDWIAGAVQRMTEDLVVRWARNAIRATGIRRLACAGGVFMNVKANMLLLDLDEVEDLFVFPGCGDESISIGAAYKVYGERVRRLGSAVSAKPLGSVYLGPEFSRSEIERSLERHVGGNKYHVRSCPNMVEVVAGLLGSGHIAGWFRGRMEWGARALGNRSILMDPRNVGRVRELNSAIKHRDFWMPFAPTILHERQREYISNPKGIGAPEMLLAFRTNGEGRRDLPATMHPYDLTVRPQLLERSRNRDYYDLLKRFEAATGVGAVLNTSFNLHGDPIVCSPDDALETFERSGLQVLALGDYLVSKCEL